MSGNHRQPIRDRKRIILASVEFASVQVLDHVRIETLCVVRDGKEENSFQLWFEFSEPTLLTDDAIGIAFSTLCGRAYKEITYDLSLSAQVVKKISEFTLASVSARIGTGGGPGTTSRVGTALSFSGGFDSLAALSLMPEDTRLISMDFGGRFSRERSFFQSFDTTIVSTNLLSTPLSKNSWSFMGSGAILSSDHYRSHYHTFGSILEAGYDNLRISPAGAKNNTFPPFRAAGFINAPYVAGLTEVGTLLVLGTYQPDLIGPSLSSLASPGEEKLYRKKVLAGIVADRKDMEFSLPDVQPPAQPHFKFGQNFALDFLSFYVAKFGGREVLDTMVSEVPQELVSLAKQLDLSLFERANATLYSHFPAELFGGLAGGLAGAGLGFYTEHDWIEYRQIRELLSDYYPIGEKN